MSLDQQIVDALAARLVDITTANGYRTDAGAHIDADDHMANEETDTFPRLAWADYSEEVTERLLETEAPIPDRHVTQLDFTVTGHDRVGTGERASDLARTLAADIKEAMIRDDDKRLGGLLVDPVRYLDRQTELPEPGGRIVSVRVRFAATYLEQAGDPDVQLTN